MNSHCDGEVWGCDVATLDDGSLRLFTTADDNRLLCYNVKQKTVLAEGVINQPKAKPKKEKGGYKGGASSMSSQPAR